MPFNLNGIPELLQFWGIGRELTPGTLVQPTVSIPLDKGQPDDDITMLIDKSIRGSMAVDQDEVSGTEIADFPLSGDVYLDSIGHLLYNLWGDYIATGSSPTNSTTLTAPVAAGATTATVASIGTIPNGASVQIGITADGNPEIVVLSAAPSGSTITFATTPARFAHASGKAVSQVVAPYTHTMSLLNSGNGQPATHTLTYHNQLTATTFARQYGYWCASAMDLKMATTEFFQHDTKGTALVGVAAASAPTNIQTGTSAEPSWRATWGIGGPASGGTQVLNITDAQISMARMIKPQFGMQGTQGPLMIPRIGMSVTGKLTFMAVDESPLITYLAGTKQQLQIALTDGANSFTFNANLAKYEKATITATDVLTWVVPFRCIANTTNAGFSGVTSPANVVLVNSVPTY